MKNNSLLWMLLFFFFFSNSLQSQVVKSEKAFIKLDNKEHKKDEKKVDKMPPELQIVSPAGLQGDKYVSNVSEINLIGKATDESGISSIIINSELVEVSKAGIFTSKLKLVPGLNEITVVAIDSEENLKEENFLIEYSPYAMTLEERVATEGKYYGLVIGINEYEDPVIPDLDNPIKDAQKLYDVLTNDYVFDKENVTFIKNAKRSDIINSLDELAEKVTLNDNLLIFYAGHGWWDQDSNNGFWLPADARDNSKAEWFRNSTIVDYLKEVKSRHTLLIADACFGGSILKVRTAFSDASKAINKLYEMPSRKAMTSGTVTMVPDQSAFIQFLVQRLKVNTEKYLSAEQLYSSFRIAVINNSDVVPQYGDIRNVGDEGGDFIFIRK